MKETKCNAEKNRSSIWKQVRTIIAVLTLFLLCLGLYGCGSSEPTEAAIDEFTVTASRDANVQINSVIAMPELEAGEKCPVVVIFHGFLGCKEESGLYFPIGEDTGFESIAESLQEKGIATISFDQAGCGTSTETLESYTLENNVSDMEDVYNYCAENYAIDTENVAVLGHSMGGKLAPLYASGHDEISVMVLLNPAGDNGGNSLITAAAAGLDYETMDAEAAKSTDGKVINQGLTDFFKKDIYMSVDYFKQVDASTTGDEVKDFVASGKKGLLIYGDKDTIINPDTYSWLVKNTGIENICVKGMTHELGLDIDDDKMTADVVASTVDFISGAFGK